MIRRKVFVVAGENSDRLEKVLLLRDRGFDARGFASAEAALFDMDEAVEGALLITYDDLAGSMDTAELVRRWRSRFQQPCVLLLSRPQRVASSTQAERGAFTARHLLILVEQALAPPPSGTWRPWAMGGEMSRRHVSAR